LPLEDKRIYPLAICRFLSRIQIMWFLFFTTYRQ